MGRRSINLDTYIEDISKTLCHTVCLNINALVLLLLQPHWLTNYVTQVRTLTVLIVDVISAHWLTTYVVLRFFLMALSNLYPTYSVELTLMIVSDLLVILFGLFHSEKEFHLHRCMIGILRSTLIVLGPKHTHASSILLCIFSLCYSPLYPDIQPIMYL